MIPAILVCSLMLGGPPLAFLQAADTGPQADPRDPTACLLRTTKGTTTLDLVSGITDAGLATKKRPLPFRELIRADFPNRRTRLPADLVVLANGDHLALTVAKIADDVVQGSRNGGPVLEIPLEFVQSIHRSLPEVAATRTARLRVASRPADHDVISLSTGDSVAGELDSFDGNQFHLATSSGVRQVPAAQVRTLVFNASLLSPVPTKPMAAVVATAHGDRITARSLQSTGQQLTVQSVWGTSISLEFDDVVTLQFAHDRITYLSETPPESVQLVPFIGDPRRWQPNQTVLGRPMIHRARTYTRGLGVTSRSELTWNVSEHFDGFHTQFGIDDSGQGGAAVFRVLVDGKTVFSSEVVRSGDPLREVPFIELKDHKTITLVVDYGPRGDVGDVANWVNAVFVRKADRDDRR